MWMVENSIFPPSIGEWFKLANLHNYSINSWKRLINTVRCEWLKMTYVTRDDWHWPIYIVNVWMVQIGMFTLWWHKQFKSAYSHGISVNGWKWLVLSIMVQIIENYLFTLWRWEWFKKPIWIAMIWIIEYVQFQPSRINKILHSMLCNELLNISCWHSHVAIC